ncbi:hypothetical protein H5410_010573 [Solanum commersonii]|uniref:Uncharacterized protein n=1 Tax=Solanum commersonii TaxID=4109 RepID=A0A9J6AM55_SOLCO|nr:hypothetical protein H5410_010573 [Solanum commersonii]
MLEVSSLKPPASESKGFAFWVELVAPDLPSVGYLSYVVCELLHRSGVFTPSYTTKDPMASRHVEDIPVIFLQPMINSTIQENHQRVKPTGQCSGKRRQKHQRLHQPASVTVSGDDDLNQISDKLSGTLSRWISILSGGRVDMYSSVLLIDNEGLEKLHKTCFLICNECVRYVSVEGINRSHIHVKEIYTNRKFRGIDKSGVYKLKPGVGHCPMAGVLLIFPVHSWHQRKNTMK